MFHPFKVIHIIALLFLVLNTNDSNHCSLHNTQTSNLLLAHIGGLMTHGFRFESIKINVTTEDVIIRLWQATTEYTISNVAMDSISKDLLVQKPVGVVNVTKYIFSYLFIIHE